MATNEELALSFQTQDWLPIPHLGRTIPFGYEVSPDDKKVLLPVVLELEALEKAKQHLKQFSLREVAQWVTQVTGRPISHMGLKKRLEAERYKKRKINGLEQLAKRAEKARASAEELLTKRTGSYNPGVDDGDWDTRL